MVVNEYLQKTRMYHVSEVLNTVVEGIRPRAVCADGFAISIQASSCHYCTPRINGAENYDSVELGFPNMEEPLIAEYAEDPDDLTGTVYGYVPVKLVDEMIKKHGGIVNI